MVMMEKKSRFHTAHLCIHFHPTTNNLKATLISAKTSCASTSLTENSYGFSKLSVQRRGRLSSSSMMCSDDATQVSRYFNTAHKTNTVPGALFSLKIVFCLEDMERTGKAFHTESRKYTVAYSRAEIKFAYRGLSCFALRFVAGDDEI